MKKNSRKIIENTLQILEEHARLGKLIHYGVLYEKLGMNRENPLDRIAGADILAEVNRITLEKNKTMISAIVTLSNEKTPAYGFFEFAVELGLFKKDASEDEKVLFWVKQITKIFKTYEK